jgi:hypothetical protein
MSPWHERQRAAQVTDPTVRALRSSDVPFATRDGRCGRPDRKVVQPMEDLVGPNFGFANKAALEAVHASPHVGYFFGRVRFL